MEEGGGDHGFPGIFDLPTYSHLWENIFKTFFTAKHSSLPRLPHPIHLPPSSQSVCFSPLLLSSFFLPLWLASSCRPVSPLENVFVTYMPYITSLSSDASILILFYIMFSVFSLYCSNSIQYSRLPGRTYMIYLIVILFSGDLVVLFGKWRRKEKMIDLEWHWTCAHAAA